jgi:hypothetical protein
VLTGRFQADGLDEDVRHGFDHRSNADSASFKPKRRSISEHHPIEIKGGTWPEYLSGGVAKHVAKPDALREHGARGPIWV